MPNPHASEPREVTQLHGTFNGHFGKDQINPTGTREYQKCAVLGTREHGLETTKSQRHCWDSTVPLLGQNCASVATNGVASGGGTTVLTAHFMLLFYTFNAHPHIKENAKVQNACIGIFSQTTFQQYLSDKQVEKAI